jgi:CHAD domain-containing protein
LREVESKFRASRDLALPSLDGCIRGVSSVDRPHEERLVAVYHDTADLRLAREGITLRRRTGGHDDGWHLKLPVVGEGPGVRDEIQRTDSGPTVPDDLARLVSAYVRFARLQSAATLVTERWTQVLRGEDGEVLAEVTDDHVTVEGTGHVSAGFREIEVEDHGGGPRVLESVGAVLRESGAVAGTFMPKLVRALGARATAQPDPPFPEEAPPTAPASRVLASYLRVQVRKLKVEDVRFRLSGPDAVHQIRVASRRMRSFLRTCRPFLDEEWSESLRTELKWLATELGGARDAEVLLGRLMRDIDALPPETVLGPVKARIEQAVGGRLAESIAEAEKTLDGERYLVLLERLVDAAWSPRCTADGDKPAADVFPDLVRKDWKRLARLVAVAQTTGADHDFHEVRIAAKRLRYAGEAVTPTFGKVASRLAAQAERVQEVLGEHQDAVIAQEALRTLARSSGGRSVGFTLGLLHQQEEARARAARAAFVDAWPEVRRRRYRDWLGR